MVLFVFQFNPVGSERVNVTTEICITKSCRKNCGGELACTLPIGSGGTLFPLAMDTRDKCQSDEPHGFFLEESKH